MTYRITQYTKTVATPWVREKISAGSLTRADLKAATNYGLQALRNKDIQALIDNGSLTIPQALHLKKETYKTLITPEGRAGFVSFMALARNARRGNDRQAPSGIAPTAALFPLAVWHPPDLGLEINKSPAAPAA